MKVRFLGTVFALCILHTGCTLSDNLLRTSVIQPLQYSAYWEVKLEQHRYRKLAKHELERARSHAQAESDNYACAPFSLDHERGFVAGFVDYLLYGGEGDPPVLPPRRYWWSGCDDPRGYGAIEDWYRGFRHGAAVAQASGYRRCVTVPLSDSIAIDTRPVYLGQFTEEGLGYGAPIEEAESILTPDGASESMAPEGASEATAPDAQGVQERLPQTPLPQTPLPPNPLPPTTWNGASPSRDEAGPLPKAWEAGPSNVATTPQAEASAAAPSATDLAGADNPQPQLLGKRSAEHAKPERGASTQSETVGSALAPVDAASPTLSPQALSQKRPASLPQVTTGVGAGAAPTTSNEQKSETSDRPAGELPSAPIAIPLREPTVFPKQEEFLRVLDEPSLPTSLPAPQNRFPRRGSRSLERNGSEGLIEDVQGPLIEPATPLRFEDARSVAPTGAGGAAVVVGAPHATASPLVSRQAMKVSPLRSSLVPPHSGMFAGCLLLGAAGLLMIRRPKSGSDAPQPSFGSPSRSQEPAGVPVEVDRTEVIDAAGCGRQRQHDASIAPKRKTIGSRHTALWLGLICCLLSGCSSLTNPVLNGIPVRKLPPELLSAPNRDVMQTVPLSLLRQKQPEDYILGQGDVLGVYVAGVFPPTTADQQLTPPPVYFPSQIDPIGAGLPPSLGYPLTIRNDGTLSLPLVDPIQIAGLTVEEANERVREIYTREGILQPGRESVMLTLMQPRQIRILVFRQEVGGFAAGGRGDISANNVKQGTGFTVDLRAYENDVVNALANTGGLPGLDSYSGIYIFRNAQSNPDLTQRLESLSPGEDPTVLSQLAAKTDYIPVRWPAAEPLPFKPEDIILNEGDVMFLEARALDVFYTAGLLPAGERALPRDYDLDVVEAVVQVSGSLVNGAFGGNNFNGLLIQKGVGNPNPSALTVIRRTPSGGQIPIRVDLNRALVDPRERILVQPGDILILQETRHEAVARYFNDIFNFNIFWQAFQRGDATGAAAVTQLPST